MMLGPVFSADLRCNSRRPRMLLLRTLFVLALLLVLWASYQSLYSLRTTALWAAVPGRFVYRPVPMGTVLADFGSRFSFFFLLIQFLFLLIVGPAYVASAVAEEK